MNFVDFDFKGSGLEEVFFMKMNMLSSISVSYMSLRMTCLHVKLYTFSISKKMVTICSLFAWAFLTVASRDKRWLIVGSASTF